MIFIVAAHSVRHGKEKIENFIKKAELIINEMQNAINELNNLNKDETSGEVLEEGITWLNDMMNRYKQLIDILNINPNEHDYYIPLRDVCEIIKDFPLDEFHDNLQKFISEPSNFNNLLVIENKYPKTAVSSCLKIVFNEQSRVSKSFAEELEKIYENPELVLCVCGCNKDIDWEKIGGAKASPENIKSEIIRHMEDYGKKGLLNRQATPDRALLGTCVQPQESEDGTQKCCFAEMLNYAYGTGNLYLVAAVPRKDIFPTDGKEPEPIWMCESEVHMGAIENGDIYLNPKFIVGYYHRLRRELGIIKNEVKPANVKYGFFYNSTLGKTSPKGWNGYTPAFFGTPKELDKRLSSSVPLDEFDF